MNDLASLSSTLLYIAFILYLIATVFFGGSIKSTKAETKEKTNRWGQIAIVITIIGFACQLGYFFTRWVAAGHAPVSDLFEFTTFFGMMLVAAFIIIYMIYRTPVLGLFALPVAIIIIAYASMFPREISPLIPALQSDWLHIHVTTAATGEAILSISFVAGLIYLIKSVDQTSRSLRTFGLEAIMFCLVVVIGFVAVSSSFAISGYESKFNYISKTDQPAEAKYSMPAIIGPRDGEAVSSNKMEPIMEVPPIINASKLNSFVWSIGAGIILYGLIRLILRKRIGAFLQRRVKNINLGLMDEISYRSVLIGFPVFTLGALIFAMIWAQMAWSRFWGWDPKEVWALVTWLFYAAFMHLRMSKGWQGEKSAWLAVIGFAIIMFNLIAVNLVIAGLHSYA